MNRIRCFWLEPTDRVEMSLRRYVHSTHCTCPAMPGKYSYHNASVVIGRAPASEMPKYYEGKPVHGDLWPHEDKRWPKQCACGYQFNGEDEWQFNPYQMFRRVDTGELMTIHSAPVGAMWNADYLADTPSYCGPDGRSIHVRTPGGNWCIDGPATNCTKPDDDTHKCWIRHGEPPDITVDKNGNTCGAGAGSILAGNYHGFLRGGYLEQC